MLCIDFMTSPYGVAVGCLYKEVYLQIIYKFLNVCPFDNTAVAGGGVNRLTTPIEWMLSVVILSTVLSRYRNCRIIGHFMQVSKTTMLTLNTDNMYNPVGTMNCFGFYVTKYLSLIFLYRWQRCHLVSIKVSNWRERAGTGYMYRRFVMVTLLPQQCNRRLYTYSTCR